MTRRRNLTPDELALWRHVTRQVRPMPGRVPQLDIRPADDKKSLILKELTMGTAALPAKLAQKPALPPVLELDRRQKTELKRGKRAIDGVLDLHGMTQTEAHDALAGFLRRMQARGARHVLIVTGKGAAAAGGAASSEGGERGVLRRVVPHWLRLPDLRPIVLAFDEAAERHGGAGALYLTLRRARGEP